MTAAPPAAVAAPAADFYAAPNPLPPGKPGDIIRAQPMHLALSIGDFPAHATRIMFRSVSVKGTPIPVTGTVLDPVAPWHGHGPRPLIAYAPGSHGLGPQCLPSKLLAKFVHFQPPKDVMTETEVAYIDGLLAQGFAVAVTDTALPTAQMDVARAAQQLPKTGIPRHGPVGLWGYSAGGSSTGAAAELVSKYAPDLDVRGAFVGAPGVDTYRSLKYVDRGLASSQANGEYVAGLIAAYPEAGPSINEAMNAAGKHLLTAITRMCIPEALLTFGLQPSSKFTVSGRPIPDVLQANPVTRAIMDSQSLKHGVPTVPAMLVTGGNDDAVPPAPVRELAALWCSKGASVTLVDLPLPKIAWGTGIGHYANWPPAAILGLTWMKDRILGLPSPNGCGSH
ncbi:MAG: lipase family protein [Nocardiaceae bacterium]|nr:lipase family protein [Nocardiaceae bacterium]